MIREFQELEVIRALGVAPSTGGIITGLLNGKVNPDNCRSVEHWPLADFDLPPQGLKVLRAIASLMEDGCELIQIESASGKSWYISGTGSQPTIMWFEKTGQFEFMVVKE